jgi:cupin fold WbuC family metalloprotein
MKIVNKEVIVKTKADFETLKLQAQESPRKRTLQMLHSSHEAELHSMINIFTKGSYAAPHMHWIKKPNGEIIKKGESFLALEGRGKIILFDQEGKLHKVIILDSEQKTMVWIPAGVWHTILATSPVFIVFENKTGPWREGEDKLFHPEFPAENTPEGGEFVEKWETL